MFVFISLMWMLSLQKTPQQFFIYSFFTSVGYITSAIFLIWKPRHSIIILSSTVISFILFYFLFSVLPITDVLHGSLVLLAVMIASQLYVQFRHTVMFRDFVRQLELNHAYEELKSKSAEINQRNFEVLLQKEKLEELNELKDRIFGIISRDFKMPLHSLKGLIFLLNSSDLISPEELKMVLKRLKHHVGHAHDLLENIQLWSKSQVKDFSLDHQHINIHDLVIECCDPVMISANEKGVTILNFVDDQIFVKADVDMIRLVLRNLISNAIEFSGNAGRIIVRSSRDERSINISVTDTSAGMEMNDQTDAFAHSFDRNGTGEKPGIGLALMVCKELIEKNNGRIWLKREPGKGNTFLFSLPISRENCDLAPNASPKSSQ